MGRPGHVSFLFSENNNDKERFIFFRLHISAFMA